MALCLPDVDLVSTLANLKYPASLVLLEHTKQTQVLSSVLFAYLQRALQPLDQHHASAMLDTLERRVYAINAFLVRTKQQ